ncbi:MAG: PKD domain-containing protein [Methanobacteriaceae archaeon]|nr:PKD domain-containing protein [Candidatus Methanorudis spinitermitis]
MSELESPPPTNSNKFTIFSNTEITYGAQISDGSSQINDKSSVNWDFGDGSSKKSGLTANHNYKNTGEYTLKLDLTVLDSGNTFTKSATYIVKVVKRPDSKPPELTPNPELSIFISNFKPLPQYGNKAAQVNLNENLVFTAFISGAYENTAKLISARWDFGNGSYKNGISINHVFKKTGWYDLKITATSSYNNKNYNSENSYRLYVVKPGNPEPEISIIISNFEPLKKYGNKTAQVNLNEKLSFNAFVSGSYANKAKITKVTWDFADKTKKTGINTNHIYKKTGGYSIKVTATTKYNGKTYTSTNIYNIYVVKKVDLSIESVKRNTDKKKNVISLTVVVKNKGAVASKTTQIKAWYSSSALKKYSKVAKVKSLTSGKSTKLTIAFKIPYKYRKYIKKIKIDPENKIDESVKNNNQRNL